MTSRCTPSTPWPPATSTRSGWNATCRGATLLTSNSEPPEWLGQLADPLLAQYALDRLQSSAYELVIEGESYRRPQEPTITNTRQDP